MEHARPEVEKADAAPALAGGGGARDPVCGMSVDPAHPKGGRHQHGGQTYGFCSARCREKFVSAPETYLEKAAPSAVPASTSPPLPAAASTGARWFCPMDADVHADKPGPCPKCGMALEAEASGAPRVEYVCPMHPQIVRAEPGPCPSAAWRSSRAPPEQRRPTTSFAT